MQKVIIIAEAGVNHNGSLEQAFRLVDIAAAAGADYVKFQTFKASKLVSGNAPKADYQQVNTGDAAKSQLEMLQQLELSTKDFGAVYDYCKTKGIGFLSTGFDDESVRYIDSLGVDFHKVPSGEITNLPYLRLIASCSKPVILSTGMADLEEVKQALGILYNEGLKPQQITILHCTTEYPAPFGEVNLRAMLTMGRAFGLETGYSDHTSGIEIPVAAVALGAVMIEKHFTISRDLPGPDHKASLEPEELSLMVRSIRNVEMALGDGIKQATPSEKKNILVARRSIHLAADLPAGHQLLTSDLAMKRPGTGISPMLLNEVTGKKLKYPLTKDTQLSWDDIR